MRWGWRRVYVCVCSSNLSASALAHPHCRGRSPASSCRVNISPLDSAWFTESLLRETQRDESTEGCRDGGGGGGVGFDNKRRIELGRGGGVGW